MTKMNEKAALKNASAFAVHVESTSDDKLTAVLRHNDAFVMRFTFDFYEDNMNPLHIDEIDMNNAPVLNSLHAVAIATSIVITNFTVETETVNDLPRVMTERRFIKPKKSA